MRTPAPRLTYHPDYERAPEGNQWAGARLMGLWVLLNQEIDARPRGVWCWRVLKGGAFVGLRRLDDGHRVLRIARRDPFTTQDGPEKWTAELNVFVRDFGCVLWQRQDEAEPENAAVAALFHEPLPGLL